MGKISYKAKTTSRNLNSFNESHDDLIVEPSVRDKIKNLEEKEDILTPEEMVEYERLIKTEDVQNKRVDNRRDR